MDRLAELKAIRESIKHWCVDIRRPLQKGRKTWDVTNHSKRWTDNNKAVPLGPDACALCTLYFCSNKGQCYYCPLMKDINGCLMIGSPYRVFFNSPTLENADRMIDVLRTAYILTERQYFEGK